MRSKASLDRSCPTRSAICRCPRRPKGRSWPRNYPESGECRLNQNKGEETMPATVANRQGQRYRSAFVAVAIALLGMGIAGSASSADRGAATDRPTTASPIKHVIVVIGENQSFDHLYATHVPPRGDSISTFWSKASSALTARRGRILPKHSSS